VANTPWSGIAGSFPGKMYLQSGQFSATVKTSIAPTSFAFGISYDLTNTPNISASTDKIYLNSGQFASELKDSQDISGVDNAPLGVSWDGTNTPWIGEGDKKLYLQSAQFSVTSNFQSLAILVKER